MRLSDESTGTALRAVYAELSRVEALNLRLGLSMLLAESASSRHVHVTDEDYLSAELIVAVEPPPPERSFDQDEPESARAVAKELLERLAGVQDWLRSVVSDRDLSYARLIVNMADDPRDRDRDDLRRPSYWAGKAALDLLDGMGVERDASS